MKTNEILKSLRQSKKLMQSDVAEILDVSLSSYQKYERDKNCVMPSIEVLMRIADYYGVSVDYLLGREPPDDPLEVMGIRVRDIDDDAFIKMYRELPDNAKRVFLDVMKRLSGAAVKESGNTAPEYGPMKHSAVTGDIIADAEAEKDA